MPDMSALGHCYRYIIWPRNAAGACRQHVAVDRGSAMGDDFFTVRREPGAHLASAYVRGHGGTFGHVLQALGEFHARHGRWPSHLHLHPETLAALVCDVTPLGLYLLQIRVALISDPVHDFLAADERGNAHAYHFGHSALLTGGADAIDAAARWLGYTSDDIAAPMHH